MYEKFKNLQLSGLGIGGNEAVLMPFVGSAIIWRDGGNQVFQRDDEIFRKFC